MRMQEIFWVRLTFNYIIRGLDDFQRFEPGMRCEFIPITIDNCHRVADFREADRISQYRKKLARKEIGFFAECFGKMTGSIWATINKAEAPTVVRTYIKLMPNEGLIHDIVTGEKSRGMGVGPFMVSRIAPVLLKEYRSSRIIIDVNIRNRISMRMMEKAGLRIDHKMLYVSIFKKLALQLVLKKYA
jgi:hypothetical protein